MFHSQFIPGHIIEKRLARLKRAFWCDEKFYSWIKNTYTKRARRAMKLKVKSFVVDDELWWDENFTLKRSCRLTSWEIW